MNLRLLVVAGLLLLAGLIARDARAEGLTLSLSVPHGKTQTTAVVNMVDPAIKNPTRGYTNSWNPCIGGIDTVIYTHASHPGGNVHGWLNENNYGRANHCHLTKKGHWYSLYALVGALRNSQFQDTVVAGPGIRFRLANTWNISVDVGAEAPIVSYGRWGGQTPVRGILPAFYIGLNYQLTKQIKVGWRQAWLPFGVTLRSGITNAPFNNGSVEERIVDAGRQPMLATLPPGLNAVFTYEF